jgi:hypothetical protein
MPHTETGCRSALVGRGDDVGAEQEREALKHEALLGGPNRAQALAKAKAIDRADLRRR